MTEAFATIAANNICALLTSWSNGGARKQPPGIRDLIGLPGPALVSPFSEGRYVGLA